ncbi:site-specific recombinase XerD [Methanolobus tindarius DSM 2278]|jgi:site-specific recombinase XerD|uniref:Site-specific recombinase XerD n=1 Tax=Methanolobus tindarius DSM 2278 TaxID=1090322 RepID=W9DVC1_METTI|nr:tyrosine-type recombinase/integrase [Methanolobus tindarius]ETA67381.1 site-specific recombinase XerD [Methanolobus tindarius DSM 2278]
MELLSQYLHDCKVRGRTCRTIESYKSSVKEFLEYFEDPISLDKHDIVLYLEYLQEKGKKPSTIQRDFSAISGFYEYLIFVDLATANPIPQIRARYLDQSYEPDRRFIPELQDLRAIIRAMENDQDETIMEQAMICTLAKTASRRGEYMELKVDDIDMSRNEIYWSRKKKRKVRLGFIDDELHDILERYFEWRAPRAKTDYLWISKRGGRIHKDYTNDILQHYATPLGLHQPGGPLHKRLTCHCLRGFATTQLERSGMKELYIHWLRGDSMKKDAMRQHYINFDPEIIRQEYLQHVPKITYFYSKYRDADINCKSYTAIC